MSWLLLAVVALIALGALVAVFLRRRAMSRERLRAAALAQLADRLGRMQEALAGPVPAAKPPARQPSALSPAVSGGRAALLDAATDAVELARADRSRLAVALVESGGRGAASLADDVRAVAGSEAYEVGTGSVALVVPGAGRADALGLLARIQAACGATGSAVELEPDEDAVELVARLLAKRAPTVSG